MPNNKKRKETTMRLENGRIVLGKKDCDNCSPNKGKVCGRSPCPECKGTGRGKRGGKNGCLNCHGYNSMNYPDWTNPQTCPVCHGNYENFSDETLFDYMPRQLWQELNFRVYRENRQLTWNEANLGYGYVFSCQDYGRAWNDTDEKIIENVKNSGNGSHQAIKITKDDGTFQVCDHVGIFVNRGGYNVRPVFVS